MQELFQLGELRISYRVFGDGPETIYMFHGYGGHPHHWDAVATSLMGRYRILVPSLSSIYSSRYMPVDFEDLVKLLQNFVQSTRRGHEKVHLIGASLGGTLAWALCAEKEIPVSTLSLLSPMPPDPYAHMRNIVLKMMIWGGRWPLLLGTWLITPMGQRALPRIEDLFLGTTRGTKKKRTLVGHPKKVGLIIHMMRQFSRILSRADWRRWEKKLSDVSTPVCLIWGRWDRLYELSLPSSIEKQLKFCRLHWVEKAGHLAMKENPEAVIEILREFLQSTSKQQAG